MRLPPFVAKLIAPDGFEEKKYFETQAAVQKWAMGEGRQNFDGDVARVEIHHQTEGLKWFRDHPKDEMDALYLRMRGDPNSKLRRSRVPENYVKRK
jgi:hypothetical protein